MRPATPVVCLRPERGQPAPKRYGGQAFRQETARASLHLIPEMHPASCRYRRSPTTKARLLRSECGQEGHNPTSPTCPA